MTGARSQTDPLDVGLFKAVLRQDADGVKKCLDAGVPADIRNASGHTPLMLAASQGYADIASALMEAGADPNAVNGSEATALMLTPWNNGKMINLLQEYGADPLQGNPNFRGSLMRAAVTCGNDCLFQALLQAGVGLKTADEAGTTLLMLACESGNEHIIRRILAEEPDLAEKDQTGRSALLHAADTGSATAIRLLLAAGAEPNEQYQSNQSPLYLAALRGCEDGVEALVKAGAKAHISDYDRDSTALRAAIRSGSAKCVRLVLDAGADPLNRSYDEKLQKHVTEEELAAAQGGEIAGLVREAAKKFHLVMAAKNGDLTAINARLDDGAPLEGMNRHGQTALLAACTGGWTKAAILLLDKGADANFVQPGHGRTPLSEAVEKADLELLEALLAHGADPNAAREKDGKTVIHAAIARASADLVDCLIRHGAKVSLEDKLGITPFQAAREGKSAQVLRLVRKQFQTEMDALAQSATELDQSVQTVRTIRFRPKTGPS